MHNCVCAMCGVGGWQILKLDKIIHFTDKEKEAQYLIIYS